MSKNFAAGFANHIDDEVTTLCTICKVTLAAGRVAANGQTTLGFTDHDRDLTVSSQLYDANTGYWRTAMQSDDSTTPDNFDTEWILDSDGLNADDLVDGVYDGASYEIRFVNWADPTVFSTVIKRGWFGEITLFDSGAQITNLGLHHKLRQHRGRTFTQNCPWDLGDANCQKDITSLIKTGTVATVTDRRQFTITWGGGDPSSVPLYSGGIIRWTAGLNNNRKMEIKTATAPGSIALYLSMRRNIQVGDTCQVVPGCKKTKEACFTDYDNIINFGGFPLLKNDAAFQYGKGDA